MKTNNSRKNYQIGAQVKAFQISVVLHALVILFIISVSDSVIPPKNFIVIDFSAEDSFNIHEGKSTHIVAPSAEIGKSSQEQKMPEQMKQEPAKQDFIEESIQKTADPLINDSKQDPQIEAKEEAVFYKEKESISSDREFQNISYASSDNMNKSDAHFSGNNYKSKTDIAKGSGTGPVNMLQTQREGYLVANFLYIKDMIQKKISYPAEARKMGWVGSAKVAFNILSNGYVNDIKIIESTGYKILDRNVIKAIQKASPFPKPPVEAQIIIPIVYRIQ